MVDEDTVLLVGDDAELASTLGDHLAARGHVVLVARTGAEARQALAARAVAVALIDIGLADTDGLALMREALGRDPPPEVVLLTGHPTLESAIAAVESRAVGYMPKPLDPGRVAGLVERVCERRRLARRNSELQAELAARLRDTEVLLAITRVVESSSAVPEALRRICRELAHLLGADTASVYLHDRPSGMLVPTAAYGVPKEHLETLARATLPLEEQGFHRLVWREMRPVFSDDVGGDPRFSHELFRRVPHQSGLLLPLVLDGAVAGVFYVVWWAARRAFTASELELLETVSGQVSLVLHNARLFEQARRDEARMAALNEVSRCLAAVPRPQDILELIVREAPRLLGMDAAGIRLVEGDDLVVAARTEDACVMPSPRLPRGEGMAWIVVTGEQPVVIADMARDDRYVADTADLVRMGFRSYLGVPLRTAQRVVGSLNVYARAPRHVQPDELAFASAFADQAAIALHNARLYEEAQAQRTRLAQILDSTSDGMVLVTPDGQIQAANPRAGELLGFDSGAVVGANLLAVLGGHRAGGGGGTATAQVLASALRDPDQGGRGDLELGHFRTTLHWVARPTRDAVGATIGFTLTFQDVTHEREVSQMKTDFVSFATHQLRTPLAGIRWMLELAELEEGVPAEARSYIGEAVAAAERLIALVNGLLDISRLEQGRMAMALEPVDVGALTRGVIDDLAGLVREKGHELVIEGGEGLPPVAADPQLLRQAILNLTANALKYTPTGGQLAVRIAREGSALRWAVSDDGIGVPRAAQPHLFEKFFRADNVAAIETEGTGLGLYLTRLILERLGGKIWYESEEGQGSTFAFTIPVKE